MTTVRPSTTPTKLRQTSRKKDAVTFDDNFREFLRDTELSARKILKESDRKRTEQLKKTKRAEKMNTLKRNALKDINNLTTTLGTNPTQIENDVTMQRGMSTTFNVDKHSMTATLPLPENVIRSSPLKKSKKRGRGTANSIPKSTVHLQEVPQTNNNNNADVTHVGGFGNSLARSANSATMRRSHGGIKQENSMATSMLRNSTAFSAENNYSDQAEGINSLKGPNAITRGLGGIRPEGIRTNVSTMSVSYHDSETQDNMVETAYGGKKSGILDMGHFVSSGRESKGKGLQNNRQINTRGGVTTSSRALFGGDETGSRPHTVAGVSPARGAPRSAATKIAMANMMTALGKNSGGGGGGERKKTKKVKIHSKLNNSIYNRSATKGFIKPMGKKMSYKFPNDKEAGQEVEPPAGGIAAPELEVVGPVNWCSDDIRIKWRGEREREEAWKMGRAAKIATEEIEKGTNHMVVPSVQMSRHPIHALYVGERAVRTPAGPPVDLRTPCRGHAGPPRNEV